MRFLGNILRPSLGEQIIFHKRFEMCINRGVERQILRRTWSMLNNRVFTEKLFPVSALLCSAAIRVAVSGAGNQFPLLDIRETLCGLH